MTKQVTIQYTQYSPDLHELPATVQHMAEQETMSVFQWPEPDYGDGVEPTTGDWFAQVWVNGDTPKDRYTIGKDWYMGGAKVDYDPDVMNDVYENDIPICYEVKPPVHDFGYTTTQGMLWLTVLTVLAGVGLGAIMSTNYWPHIFTGIILFGMVACGVWVKPYIDRWLDRRVNKFQSETRGYVPFEGIANITWKEDK